MRCIVEPTESGRLVNEKSLATFPKKFPAQLLLLRIHKYDRAGNKIAPGTRTRQNVRARRNKNRELTRINFFLAAASLRTWYARPPRIKLPVIGASLKVLRAPRRAVHGTSTKNAPITMLISIYMREKFHV